MTRQEGRDKASQGKKSSSSNGKKMNRGRSSDEEEFLHRHERQTSEDNSLNSSSTESTRPTVHTRRATSAGSPSQSRSREDLSESYTSSFDNNHRKSGHPPTSKKGKNHAQSQGHSHTTPRQRVPGGAAAKLMLRGPQKSADSSEVLSNQTTESHDDGPVDTSGIHDMINRAKVEFETGRRSSPLTIGCGDEEIEVSYPDSMNNTDHEAHDHTSAASTFPHILNREEAYHESASAAVAAILNPQKSDNSSASSNPSELCATHSGSRLHTIHSTQHNNASVSAFQSPKFTDCASVASGGSNCDELFDSRQGASHLRSPTTEPLISGETEAKLDRMSQKMMDPSKTLSDLLRAIASSDDVTAKDRAYMVRRKNACGALKVLTAHNRRRKQICWTVGVLPALTSVLQDAGDDRLENVYPDVRTRMEYEEARRRAIAALTNLAMPVSNRLAVFHTRGLVQALISTVMKVDGECLEGACAILAYLAKSNENKILMAQVPGLFEAVLRVLRPKVKEEESLSQNSPKGSYPCTSSMSDSGSSTSSGDLEDGEGEDRDELEEASILSGSTATASSDGDSSGDDEEDDEDVDVDTSDDDMSTDRESMTGSEGSGSSASDTSGDESGSEYRHSTTKKAAAKNQQQKGGSAAKASSPKSDSYRTKFPSDYDKDKLIAASRKNLFAMLGHLVKEKDNAYRLARVNDLVPVVVEISKMHDSPIHILAVQLLAHLTRHRLNSKSLVFKMQVFIQAMVQATYSPSEICRRYACFAIQNFSNDKSCRQELASSDKLITALCKRARHSKDPEERLAAICALKNLTDEPANLIPLSNTAECIATLMQIAHGQEEGVTEMMQFRACDALATISHWLRKIATNGQSTEAMKDGDVVPTTMFVPSLKVVGWEQYT